MDAVNKCRAFSAVAGCAGGELGGAGVVGFHVSAQFSGEAVKCVQLGTGEKDERVGPGTASGRLSLGCAPALVHVVFLVDRDGSNE